MSFAALLHPIPCTLYFYYSLVSPNISFIMLYLIFDSNYFLEAYLSRFMLIFQPVSIKIVKTAVTEIVFPVCVCVNLYTCVFVLVCERLCEYVTECVCAHVCLNVYVHV